MKIVVDFPPSLLFEPAFTEHGVTHYGQLGRVTAGHILKVEFEPVHHTRGAPDLAHLPRHHRDGDPGVDGGALVGAELEPVEAARAAPHRPHARGAGHAALGGGAVFAVPRSGHRVCSVKKHQWMGLGPWLSPPPITTLLKVCILLSLSNIRFTIIYLIKLFIRQYYKLKEHSSTQKSLRQWNSSVFVKELADGGLSLDHLQTYFRLCQVLINVLLAPQLLAVVEGICDSSYKVVPEVKVGNF